MSGTSTPGTSQASPASQPSSAPPTGGPSCAGASGIDLAPLVRAIEQQRLGVRAIHVHRAGTDPAADAVHRFADDTVENVYSISKTVTALAVGIAREEGLLDLDDLLADHLEGISDMPREALGEGVERITLRHLLTMTSGSPVLMFAQEERDDPDPAALFLETDVVREPGSGFEYSNGGVHLLARVIGARAGVTLRDYLMPRLFEPLGILNPQWHTERGGNPWGATGLHLRSGELARIGALLLERGRWVAAPGEADAGTAPAAPAAAEAPAITAEPAAATTGATSARSDPADGTTLQLVPAAWIDALHAEENWVPTGDGDPENVQYGFGVWRCTPPGAWRADGAYGQFLVVLPEQGAVVTITSHHEGVTQDILRALWMELLPQL